MKVKVLNDGGFIGINEVIGKVLNADVSPIGGGCIVITGGELIANGAVPAYFHKNVDYYFRLGAEAKIVDEPCGGCNGDECDLHAKSYHEKK